MEAKQQETNQGACADPPPAATGEPASREASVLDWGSLKEGFASNFLSIFFFID